MKATIDIPDELYRRVYAKSAREGKSLRDVTAELYRSWLNDPASSNADDSFVSVGALMADACGVVGSGVGDLSTNPKHLDGFGDATSRNR